MVVAVINETKRADKVAQSLLLCRENFGMSHGYHSKVNTWKVVYHS